MSAVELSLGLAINATSTTFLENPVNYSDERSLAEETRRRLCVIGSVEILFMSCDLLRS